MKILANSGSAKSGFEQPGKDTNIVSCDNESFMVFVMDLHARSIRSFIGGFLVWVGKC